MSDKLDSAATTQNSTDTSDVNSAVDSQDQAAVADSAVGNNEQSTEKTTEDDAAKVEGAPEAYSFSDPEGTALDPQVIEQFSAVAKELNMSQEAAQKLIDKMGPAMAQRQAEAVAAIHEQWVGEAKADKEFGGAALDENLGVAKKALDAFGTPKLTELLNETGLGNHPEMIRLLVRAGKAISNDAFVSGGPNNAPEVSLAQRMYDGMNP